MNLKEVNSKTIFSSRVQNYAKYRPSYPSSIINFLHEVIGLNKESIIADIGSGTGISSKMFLDNGNTVYGVEPNKDMRQAAEKFLEAYSNFYSIDGYSESTKLQSESVDIIAIAQAFHWFDPEPTKREFLRILKPNGSVVLMWNNRKSESNQAFMGEYLNIIKRYREKVKIKADESVLPKFFEQKIVYEKVFYNPQEFDLERLKGELTSYSYIPNENHPKFVSMVLEIEDLFEKYNDDGKVVLEYETHVYYCKMK